MSEFSSNPLKKAAVFFDRDGTLNVDLDYVCDPSKLQWVEGAKEAVKAVNDAGMFAIVITNQSGIARGYYTVEQMKEFHRAMELDLLQIGAQIDHFYYCPYHEEGIVDEYTIKNHPDRKPNPGMIYRAAADLDIDLGRSIVVGDRQSDLEAAKNANIRGYLYKNGNLHHQLVEILNVNSHQSS